MLFGCADPFIVLNCFPISSYADADEFEIPKLKVEKGRLHGETNTVKVDLIQKVFFVKS